MPVFGKTLGDYLRAGPTLFALFLWLPASFIHFVTTKLVKRPA